MLFSLVHWGHQAPVVQKVDSTIHWIKVCPVDNVIKKGVPQITTNPSKMICPMYSAIQVLTNWGQASYLLY